MYALADRLGRKSWIVRYERWPKRNVYSFDTRYMVQTRNENLGKIVVSPSAIIANSLLPIVPVRGQQETSRVSAWCLGVFGQDGGDGTVGHDVGFVRPGSRVSPVDEKEQGARRLSVRLDLTATASTTATATAKARRSPAHFLICSKFVQSLKAG